MKSFTYEELRAYVKEQLASGKNVVKCHPRRVQNNTVILFIKLDEDIRYKPFWLGSHKSLKHGYLYFKKGDYINTDAKDIYGLTATTFANCYVIESPIL